jgi:hypothetical protein
MTTKGAYLPCASSFFFFFLVYCHDLGLKKNVLSIVSNHIPHLGCQIKSNIMTISIKKKWSGNSLTWAAHAVSPFFFSKKIKIKIV